MPYNCALFRGILLLHYYGKKTGQVRYLGQYFIPNNTYQVGAYKSKSMNFKVWLALKANTRPLSVPRRRRPETEIWTRYLCYGWDSNFVIEDCFALNCTLNSFKLFSQMKKMHWEFKTDCISMLKLFHIAFVSLVIKLWSKDPKQLTRGNGHPRLQG